MTNVLLLWTDQQRFDSLACYGNDWLQMPHLNALAEHSTVFERAYCTSPVCTPSRGSVLTGLMPHAHGARSNNKPLHAHTQCLPELLGGDRASGYVGKWHLGDEIYPQHGFDEWVASEDGYQDFFSPQRNPDDRSPFHHHLLAKGYEPDKRNFFPRNWTMLLPERDSKPAFISDHAIDFVSRHQDQPWVLSVNTLEPHHPLMGPLADHLTPDDVPLGPNFLHDGGGKEPLPLLIDRARWANEGIDGFHLQTAESWKNMAAHYWGQCHHVDRQYGRLLQALHDSGQYDDTLIIFCSDHGENMGSHGLFGKHSPHDTSARIPFLVKLPGQREQRRISQPVSLVDVTPTVIDVLGGSIPDGLHGRSLLPCCRGEAIPERDVVVHWHRPKEPKPDSIKDYERPLADPEAILAARGCSYRCLVTPELEKFVYFITGDICLFDLKSDPDELTNIADQVSNEHLQALTARLKKRIAEDDDDFVIPV
ncbi:MAG: DUF229 domain-containing protein [Planctomycetota bacterium]|nr:MAG: DUF229 domain-containing protein [Planctomycetota bacterium]